MQRSTLLSVVFLVSLTLGLQTSTARADLTLTLAGTTAGFSLSTFASGFPTTGFCCGPLGIAFPGAGVLVTDYPGNVRVFPTDIDAQLAATFPPVAGAIYPSTNAVGLAQVGTHFYMTQQGAGKVVEVTATGTFVQDIVSIGFATGIVTNPANGHLFVSNTSQIFDVNPVTKTSTLFVTASADGLSITSDGSILYAALLSTGNIVGYNTTSKAVVFDSGAIAGGLDGTALGFGSLAGNIFGLTNGGTLVEVDLATKAQTLLATGGSRGDFVSVDPNNNTLLLTQTDRIVRLIPPTGGGFGPPPSGVPEPATWLLLGSGLAGLALWRRRAS